MTSITSRPLPNADELPSTAVVMSALQGTWSSEQYLRLTDPLAQLIEFTDGELEFLPMPTRQHQAIVQMLFELLLPLVRALGGALYLAPLRLEIRPGKFREPDLMLLRHKNDPRNQNRYWTGADLVIEVVSADDPTRDTVTKVRDYAEAGIAEYWIVNPLDETIKVLVLRDEHYHEHGHFKRGEQAQSALAASLSVAVDAIFDAE